MPGLPRSFILVFSFFGFTGMTSFSWDVVLTDGRGDVGLFCFILGLILRGFFNGNMGPSAMIVV